MKEDSDKSPVLRIIDANLNRLREALRVIEEYFRFVNLDEGKAIRLKQARHSLEDIERSFGTGTLVSCRDTETDPFAAANRPEETGRTSVMDTLAANFKRAQEASRVIEEYAKITDSPHISECAKKIRFSVYAIEKDTYGDKYR
jgi:thiamine-phosphate pyrophosphorylase